MTDDIDLPIGIARDDTSHGITYYTEADVRNAVMDDREKQHKNLTARVAELEAGLRLAKNSYGITLMSDPPQDAWRFHRVSEKIAALLAKGE